MIDKEETLPTISSSNKQSVSLRILSDEDIQQIHTATLQVLDENGIKILSDRGLDLVQSAGARVDRQNQIARIGPDIVEKCLQTAAKSFLMAGRQSSKDIQMDMSGRIFSRNGGGPGHVRDMETSEVHTASTADVSDYARLVDAIDNIEIAAPIYSQDTPAPTRDIHTLATVFASTTKHINMRLLNLHSLPYVIRMAEIVAGGRENLKKRPVITLLESPVAPLKIPDVLVESLIACGDAGIPLEICSMPIAGATGPITLAGSLLMSNVEMVASIVISQIANPGAALIFTPRIMIMDLRTGHALTGSIENALLASSGVQLAREAYGIPVNMHGPYTDSLASDSQAGIENTYFTLLPALVGANILTGSGHLQGGLFVSYTQLLIDSELTGIVQRAVRGFKVDPGTLAIDVLRRSMTAQSLLTDKHTMTNMRTIDSFRPTLLTRDPRQTWLDEGSPTMEHRAHARAKSLLATHEVVPLDPGVQKEIKELIREADSKLVG